MEENLTKTHESLEVYTIEDAISVIEKAMKARKNKFLLQRKLCP